MGRSAPRLALLVACLAAAGALVFGATSLPAGVVGSPHDFSVAGPHPPSVMLAPSGACSGCHVPHGANDNGIWRRSLAAYRTAFDSASSPRNGTGSEPDFILPPAMHCYDCHDFHGGGALEGASVPALTDYATGYKPQNILFGYSAVGSVYPKTVTEYNSGPQAGKSPQSGYYETNPVGTAGSPNYGVNLSAPLNQTGGHYFQNDPSTNNTFDNGDKLPCRDCHDPHAWTSSPYWGAFIRKTWPAGSSIPGRLPTTPQGSAFMSNQSTPTGQRSNQESRKICIACHGIAGPAAVLPVNFSDIQPSTGATSYRSALIMGGAAPPATVAEHASSSTVACVSCHNHNNIGASCSQCHGFPPSDTASPAYPVTASSTFVPAPPPGANDSHPKHYGTKSGGTANSFSVYSFTCDVCHYGSYGTGAATLNQHQNNLVSVVLLGPWTKSGGTYDNTNYYNRDFTPMPPPVQYTGQLDNTNNKVSTGGWGNAARWGGNNCRNVYCHSAGREKLSMDPTPGTDCTILYPRPTWNSGPLHCNDCHGFGTDNTTSGGINYGMPNYVSGAAGTPTANSHGAHVVTAGIECSVCHALTVGGTRAGRFILATVPTHHVDGNRDVNFDGVNAVGTYNPTGPPAKTCNVSCHGQGKPAAQQPQWGAGPLAFGCFACHSGTEQAIKPQDDYGTAKNPNPVDNTQYLTTGHGFPKAQQYADNNAGAGFGNYLGTPSDCYICHSQAAAHFSKSANDPFRLGASADGTTGGLGTWTGPWGNDNSIDAMCLGCHGDAAQRSGHTNAAVGAVDMQAHSKAITGGTKTWPVTPWKCVDCHDPHGDDSWAMIRSGINAPNNPTDTGAGSDVKGRPRNNGANVHAVTFTSRAGFAANSFAISGAGNWGICEVCHTQTNAYASTAAYGGGVDNAANHGSRIGACTTCHPHNAGFAAKACKGCHGPDGTLSYAPNISANWTTGGHGMAAITARRGGTAVQCEDCHDTGYLTSADHKTNLSGTPPANINTLNWLGKPAQTGDTTPNLNTSHLKAAYDNASATTRAAVARRFDAACAGPAAGCHVSDWHRHQRTSNMGVPYPAPNDVMRFGDNNTVANPKLFNWYSVSSYTSGYPSFFYASPSAWTDNDIFVKSGMGGDAGTAYGLCISCHDPHGTAVGETTPTGWGGGSTNHMLRGTWLPPGSGPFCGACHK